MPSGKQKSSFGAVTFTMFMNVFTPQFSMAVLGAAEPCAFRMTQDMQCAPRELIIGIALNVWFELYMYTFCLLVFFKYLFFSKYVVDV